jgi:hypothetical protein
MYAWVRRIALGLAPERLRFYLHLRTGFYWRTPFSTRINIGVVGRRLPGLRGLP